MTPVKNFCRAFLVTSAVLLTSCFVEDPGPLQEMERQYAVTDFDRLEMGDAFHISVEQGNYFDVSARGDRRNIQDLVVKKEGSTLVIRYSHNRQRRHDTFITITLPDLHAITFSGASDSRVYGFDDMATLKVNLSGASVCQLDVEVLQLTATISGASFLSLRGAADDLEAELSGASALKAFSFPVSNANLVLSGASDGQVTAMNTLQVVATGASHVIYRGQPAVTAQVSGSSSVHEE